MEIRIRVKTPKGYASKIEGKIRFFIIGRKAHKLNIEKDEEDSEIVWVIEGDPRKLNKIIRNVSLYDTIMSKTLDHRITRKAIKKQLDLEGQKELQEMLMNQTTVELIKGRKPKDNANERPPMMIGSRKKIKAKG